MKINYTGDFAGGTTVDGKELNVSSGKLKVGKWTLDGSGDDLKVYNNDIKDKSFRMLKDGVFEVDSHIRANKGWLDLANNWRIRTDDDWFNIDKNNTWKLSVYKDDMTQVRDFKSDKNVNVKGIVLENDNNWLKTNAGLKLGGYINMPNNWSIEPTGDHMEFKRDQKPQFKINKDGDVWRGGLANDRQWASNEGAWG